VSTLQEPAFSVEELQESARRLVAIGVLVGVRLHDRLVRVVSTHADAHQAVLDGFTLYSPREMYMYVTLSERERRLLHDFKKRYSATVDGDTLR